MVQAVTHVLIPLIILSLFRDFLKKENKKKFPLHYVLIGGLAGLLPDLDVAAYYVLGFFGFTINQVHRTFSHNLFIVLFFIILGVIFYFSKLRIKEFGKHGLKIHKVMFVISFGIFVHLVLDALIAGVIIPFYPFQDFFIGFYLIRLLPLAWQDSFIPSLDAALLVLWIIYLEVKHKISDFI